MAIYSKNEILGWRTGDQFFCTDCEPDPDEEPTPIVKGGYDPDKYVVICDHCGK